MAAGSTRREESWSRRLRRFADMAVQFVLPPACVACRQPGAVFCADCENSLTWFSELACPACGRPMPAPGLGCAWCGGDARPLKEIRAVCAFEGAAREAIHALKYEGMFGAAEPLARLMAERFPPWTHTPDLVIPIPLHPERVKERGYNQATLLAKLLCDRLSLEMDANVLQRTRHTRPQVGLDRLQRRRNVAGAFSANGAQVKGRHILLVDDVCTSGATLAAAAEALLEKGAASVSGYSFTRPVAKLDV